MTAPSFNEHCCPHCGGTKGYYVTSVVTVKYGFRWDDSKLGEMGGTRKHHNRPTIRRCFDCGRRV